MFDLNLSFCFEMKSKRLGLIAPNIEQMSSGVSRMHGQRIRQGNAKENRMFLHVRSDALTVGFKQLGMERKTENKMFELVLSKICAVVDKSFDPVSFKKNENCLIY